MRILLVVAAATLAGCGSIEGTTCSDVGAKRCDGSDVAYCERGGTWQTYACPSGCDVVKQACDWRGVKAGTLCSPQANGQGVCTADGELTICSVSSTGPAAFVSGPCAPCVNGKRLDELVPQGKDGLYHCD